MYVSLAVRSALIMQPSSRVNLVLWIIEPVELSSISRLAAAFPRRASGASIRRSTPPHSILMDDHVLTIQKFWEKKSYCRLLILEYGSFREITDQIKKIITGRSGQDRLAAWT